MRALVTELGDPGLAGLQGLGPVFVPRKREESKRKGVRERKVRVLFRTVVDTRVYFCGWYLTPT